VYRDNLYSGLTRPDNGVSFISSIELAEMTQKRTVFYYILGQIIPTFILGIVVFVFIILMFQFLKLTELILAHNVGVDKVLQLLLDLSIGFLPIILPMSLLFAVLLTYSRFSTDSEIVALKALGYSPLYLALPSIAFSVVVSFVSAQTLFNLGPIARMNFDQLLTAIGNQQVMSSIEEGTFSESFFDLVLYTNQIDKQQNLMRDLFIYDKRNPRSPIAIVAKEGRISTNANIESQSASILLTNGNMYKLGSDSHTKVRFDTYNLNISSPTRKNTDEKDADNYTLSELQALMGKEDITPQKKAVFTAEFHGRLAIAISCLLFGFLGSALGSRTNRRSSASSGFVVSVICIIAYWMLYVVATNMASKMIINPSLGLWIPNIVFLIITIWAWRHQSRV